MIKRIILLMPLWLMLGLIVKWLWSNQTEAHTVESIGILTVITGTLVVFGVMMSVEFNKDLLKQEIKVHVKTQIERELGNFSILKGWPISKTDKRLVVMTTSDELYSVHTTGPQVVKIIKL